ncbi:MAG: CoB--CoM heterodisulfide reductase iron-sulfur subunit B family protein [Desulfobacterales bacterium]|jgi:heterodisulfide reductase subunit B
MRYLYYPGCSLEGTASEYDLSTRRVMQAADVELIEIEDWTCCGASAAEATSELLSLALPARNLAIAEKMDDVSDILVPCSACYLNLKKVEEKTRKDQKLMDTLNDILAEEQLHLQRRVTVRHLLDVVANDIGTQKIQGLVKRHFSNLNIAPYYGCQCLRPYRIFDDPEKPRSMEPIIEAIGAKVHRWHMGAKCCGASHMNTRMEVGIELVANILKGAKGADAIVTVCPMCQMNLEAHQRKISNFKHEDLEMTVLYLPQLLGLAFGIPDKELGLNLNLAISDRFYEKLKKAA